MFPAATRGLRVLAAARSLPSLLSARSRGFASLVSSEWLREAGGRKLLVVDCEQPAVFLRAHIPGAQPLALAATGLKVRVHWWWVAGEVMAGSYDWLATTQDSRSTGAIDERGFEQVLELLRVEEDATLVFYDDDYGLVR